MYLSKSLARFPRYMGDDWKRLWRAYRWSNIDFSPKRGRAKGMKEWSTSTNNHPSMSRWCHFWDNSQHNHSKQAWKVLQESNQRAENIRKIRLQKQHGDFEKLHMLKSENISEYFTRVLAIYNQIKRYEEKVEETRMVEKILHLVQKKFHYVVVTIEES